MDAALQDIRYAIRLCLRTPGFTLVAVLALALGIGANTAIFTIVNAVLLERLPFRDADRIVVLWEEYADRPGRSNVLGPAQYLRWSDRVTAFDKMAALVDTRANITGGGDPEEVVVQNVTADFFPILGVPPLVGRTFSAAENADPNSAAVVLGYEFWQRRFGGDPNVVGQTIQLNSRPQTVVGVMPPAFRLFLKQGSLAGKPSDLWAPWVLPANGRTAGGRYHEAIARLKPGVSAAEAETQLKTIAAALAVETPQRNKNWTAQVRPLHDELSGEYRRSLLVLAGAVAFVLLIACANVANLLLARGAVRQREIAIRSALGAPRRRVIRQLLTESFVLAALGGAAGLLFAIWGVDLLIALSPVDLATASSARVSYPVLAFTAVVSLLTAIACGIAPAFEGSRTDVHETLKDAARQGGGGVRHRRMRQAFVVSEVALAVVLLVGAVSFLPLTGLGAGTAFTIEGEPPPPPGQDHVTNVSVCDNGYFRTMNVPLVRGRLFTEREMREKSNVVLISESLARKYFPREDPIGKRLGIYMTSPIVPTEVIGVVGDVRFQDLTAPPRPTTYWPHPQLAYSSMTLTVRAAGDPLTLAPAVERTVHELDKDQPVAEVRTMGQWVAKSLAQARFSSTLLALFAALALLLAAIGIYGVMSYAVSQRTSEIGIRLAIGADRGDIVRMILANGARLAGAGLAVGVALALALNRTLASLLYETTGTDPITFAGVVGVLGGVAVLASYLPARRASRIPPVDALRAQ